MSDFYERINNLSQKRLVLLAMELQARLSALEGIPEKPTGGHDIAVIGMACRFPGNANTPQAFWELLQEGRDAITEIPAERWDINAYYDEALEASGKMNTRWGGFMTGVDQFDPALFGITPREATTMDPQQRVLLEVCWEALENAGLAPDRLSGSATGVFVGACNNDYGHLLMNTGLDSADMYLATGGAHSVLSGRVSYVLGLQGPAITVDTACSSSLVAIHYAIQSLRNGESRMALAGGVNAILTPDVSITLSKAKMMATDGRCKAFAADADGFVRSEGCGMLVLKRLEDAQADGDRILAVIRGSAINQDGRSNGLTAPNGPSQVAVIRAALADAGLEPEEVGYVETHGTGTSLGDPIEAQALGAAYGPGHAKENPLMIGSVKTNLGHLESAAGVAGMMKLILALQHGEIPPHLHLKELSPHIPWEDLPIHIPTGRTPWAGRRVGGLSSFGFSGTNVHILAENYQPEPAPAPQTPGALRLLVLSARSAAALNALAGRYERLLETTPETDWPDIAYSANTGRARLAHRLALTAADPAQARQKLAALHADPENSGVWRSSTPVARPPEVTFLFTGHGAQYVNMGRSLYETEPVFRQAVDRVSELSRAYLPRPLIDALYPPDEAARGLMDTMTYGQPAIFALQIGLAELWRAWGVQPAAVAGHSLGEYAAAVVAGIFSLEDGLKLVCTRGRLMDNLPQAGSMASVFTTEAEIAEVLQPLAGQVSIAVINAPTNIVISGIPTAVETALTAFEARGVKTRRLAIAAGAHSPLVDPMRAEFERIAAEVGYTQPRIDLVSCTTARLVGPDEACQPGYWWRHLRQPVQFAALMETLRERGQTVFVEIGPHPVLISIGQRVLPAGYGVWLPSLREKTDDRQQMLETLGGLFVEGVEIHWQGFYAGARYRRVALPTYPFDHQRYWFNPPGGAVQPGRSAPGISPLLDARLSSPALEGEVFESHLSAHWPPYLDHHRIFGTSIAPSPALIEMAARAAEELYGPGMYTVSNLAILEAMILPEEGLRTAQIILTPCEAGGADFKIVSQEPAGGWKTHATGTVTTQSAPPPGDPDETLRQIAAAQERCAEQISGPDYYAGIAGLGLEFGESFRGLAQVWRRDGEALGRVEMPERIQPEAGAYRFHPALLDACFHLLGAPLPGAQVEAAFLLIGIEHFRMYRPPSGVLWNHTTLSDHTGETFTGDIRLYDENGSLVAEAQGLQLKRASRELLMRAVRPRFDDWFYTVEWRPRPLAEEPPAQAAAPAAWAVLAGESEFGRELAEKLSAQGQPCTLLYPGETALLGSGLVYLAGLDEPIDVATAELLERQTRLCLGALDAARAGARLWIVTRGAQPAAGEGAEPAQAALWGLGRVIALEHPEAWGGLVDLDPNQPLEAQAAALAAELRSGSLEDQVAYRRGERLTARLSRCPRPSTPVVPLAPEAAYLVTGGLGGLGLEIARWLAAQGARHLVLTGRRGLPEREQWDALPVGSRAAAQAAAIRAIEAETGACVEAVAVDVGDRESMRELIAAFGAARPPLKGVIHAAAALSNRVVDELTRDDLTDMFRPKIAGTWNLHELTQALDLDFLILFSSSTALWGSSLLAHYAAANAFMDAFAHYRRGLGLPALSINWGTWEVMRAASDADQQRVAQFGLEQMPVEAALGILGGLLGSPLAQITVAAVDWGALKPAYEARRARPLLAELETKKAPSKEPAAARKVTLAEQVQGLPADERRARIVEHVRGQVARVVGATDPAALDIQQGLFEMGMDSLMSVELKSRLEAGAGQPLPSTLTFNYPTIADLARYLDETVLAAQTPPPAPPPSTAAQAELPDETADSDDLSEDDLAAMLAAKLSKLK